MINPGPYVEFYLKSEENPPEGFEQEEPWCYKVEMVRLGSLAVTMLVHVGDDGRLYQRGNGCQGAER